jgi:hypothetical protein
MWLRDGVMKMSSISQMPIPKSQSEAVFQFVIDVIAIVFAILAIVDLCSGVALVASCLWLVLVTITVWISAQEACGLRSVFISHIGSLLGRYFVEVDSVETPLGSLRFGFQLFGHRFVEWSVPLDSITLVKWSTGQASGIAGRDMNDWHVTLRFNHSDPAKAEVQRQRQYTKPEQELHSIGPSAPKDHAETFGLALIDFLRDAGVDFVQGAEPTCYVRQME